MASVFSKIVQGEIPAYKVAEDDYFLAFLDVNPLAKGHTLVIPKKEVDYLFDLDDTLYNGLMIFAKKVAKALEKTVTCERIGVAVIGLEVPHAHIHLVPINHVGDINFSAPRVVLSKDEFQVIAQSIKDNFGLIKSAL